MDRMQIIYWALRECIVRITATTASGDVSTGAGFHIGQGYFVTARHVVEGCENIAVEHMEGFAMIKSIAIESRLFPSDRKIDLCVLQTKIEFTEYYLKGYKTIPGRSPEDFKGIPFGALTDASVSDYHILGSVLLMGFPRIPLSDRPQLVAVRGEINATIRKYIGPSHYYHVISTVARGGFSGGPVIDDDGFLAGIFTESLITDGKESELGFAAAISIEPLLRLLKTHKIKLPENFNVFFRDQAKNYDSWYETSKTDTHKYL